MGGWKSEMPSLTTNEGVVFRTEVCGSDVRDADR